MRLLNLAVVALAAVPFGSALPSPQSEKQKSPKEIQKHPDSDSPPEGYGPEKYHRIDEKYICAKFDGFAKEADFIFNLVNVLECGDDQCWEPVRNAIYKLEYGIDVVDTDIDNSDRSYIWSCSQEAIISGCYQRYANILIKALRLLKDRSRYIEARTAKFINLAVNSLRASDHVLVYELVNRMRCEEHQMAIMQKHGATDGSTPHSVREAFSEFVFTPLITGDDFKKAPEPKKEYGPVAPVGAYPQGRAWYPGPQGPPVQQVYRGPPGQQGQFGRPAPQGHQGQAGHPGHAGYQGHQGHAGHSGQLGPPGQQYLPQKFNPQGPPGPNHQQRPAPNQPHGQPARHGESQGQPDNKPGHQHEQAPKPSEESHKGCKEKKKSKS